MSEPWHARDGVWALSEGLAGYLTAVARELGIPSEGTTFEVSDTATAYLALDCRWPRHPGRDLMLVWCERIGWAVSLETVPGEPQTVLARLGGDRVPEPRAVAQFVTDTLTGDSPQPGAAVVPAETNRLRLAESMTRYTRP